MSISDPSSYEQNSAQGLESTSSFTHVCTADIPAICNIVYSRSCKFLSRSLLSYAPIVSSIIRESSSLVYTFLGYNNLYGSHHLKFYSNYDFDISFFVRSVRLYYGFNSLFENFIRDVVCSYLALYLLHHLLLFPFFYFYFFNISCGCIRVYQWSVQERALGW